MLQMAIRRRDRLGTRNAIVRYQPFSEELQWQLLTEARAAVEQAPGMETNEKQILLQLVRDVISLYTRQHYSYRTP
jgi:hypothetical protein